MLWLLLERKKISSVKLLEKRYTSIITASFSIYCLAVFPVSLPFFSLYFFILSLFNQKQREPHILKRYMARPDSIQKDRCAVPGASSSSRRASHSVHKYVMTTESAQRCCGQKLSEHSRGTLYTAHSLPVPPIVLLLVSAVDTHTRPYSPFPYVGWHTFLFILLYLQPCAFNVPP